MKALVFEKTGPAGDVLHLQTASEPRMGPRDILVEIRARAVQPSDHMYIAGTYRWKPVLPQIAGLEGVGEVLSCGTDVDPALGLGPGSIVAFRHPGAWAERIALPASEALPLPSGLSWADASQLLLNPLTARGLLETAAVRAGDAVMANAGTSSVSHWLAAWSGDLGNRFFCSVRSPESVSRAPGSAARVFVEGDASLPELEGTAAFFDSVGGESARRGLETLRPGGIFVAYGRFEQKPVSLDTSLLIYRDIRMRGFGFQAWFQAQPRARIVEVLDQAGRLLHSAEAGFTRPSVFSLDDFQAALASQDRIVLANA